MALETRYSRLYGGFIVNSEQFSSFILVFLLMNLNKWMMAGFLAGRSW